MTPVLGLVVGLLGQYRAEGFSAQFPGTVAVTKSMVSTGSGQLTGTVYRSGEGQSVFQVMVTPLTTGVTTGRGALELLDAARKGAETASQTQAESVQNLLVDGYPAVRFALSVAHSPKVLHCIVLANGRLYQVTAMVGNSDMSKGVAFLGSFSLSAGAF